MGRSPRPVSLQACLQALGAKRVEASLLSDLVQHGASATEEIIDRTGLRQPEVSVGMRTLRERGWVDSHPIPRAGKGRPMHKYQLTLGPADLRQHFIDEGRKRIEEFHQAIEEVGKVLEG